MSQKLPEGDRQLLCSLAEYRVLTVKQAAILHGRGFRGIHKRLAELSKARLVHAGSLGYAGKKGRPEKAVSLAEGGIRVLRAAGLLGQDVPARRVVAEAIRCLDHQLAVNWVRVHLAHVSTFLPQLTVRFLSPTSPYLPLDPEGRPTVWGPGPANDGHSEMVGFTPDGVFSVSDTEQKRTLLFFLEVDMGTETFASSRNRRHDVRQKVLNYQAYFRSERYRRYERLWGCQLRGFRLLFLAPDKDRWAALCRLVRDTPPSDFVWVAEQTQLLQEGAWSKIWARGGHLDSPLQSILGSHLPSPCPMPPELR